MKLQYAQVQEKLQTEALDLLKNGGKPLHVAWAYWHELAHLKFGAILKQSVIAASVEPGQVTFSENENYGMDILHESVAFFAPIYFYITDESIFGKKMRNQLGFTKIISQYKSFHWLLFDALFRNTKYG